MIVDDHPLVTEGLANLMTTRAVANVVARCTSIAEARAAVRSARPQIALLDVRVGEESSIDLVIELRARGDEIRAVFMTGHDEPVFFQRALAAEAMGYVLKCESVDEIIATVAAVAAGRRHLSPLSVQLFGGLPLASEPTASVPDHRPLTPREREILRLVSLGMSARAIAADLKISTWTVTNHKANIMAKLGIRNQVGLTRFALTMGIGTP